MKISGILLLCLLYVGGQSRNLLMMFCFVLLTLVAVAFALPFTSELDEEWQTFKQHYGKQYSKEDELIRRLVWERNVLHIVKHNLEADRGEHSYRLGVNQYADLTTEEFVRQMNGYRMMNGTSGGATFLPPTNIKVPDTVDWRKKGYVTPVKNQKACGSCWAFSATGSLEGQHFKSTGKLVSLSEQNLVDCSRPQGNDGCDGGLPSLAFEYIKTNDGIDTETSYPYEARDGKCRFKRADVGATDTGFTRITKDDEKALQQAVATVGPISVGIDANHGSFQLYKSGVYDEPKCSSEKLDHGVLVVGYGTFEGRDYWLVKNSWSKAWGEKGYIMMSRNKHNQCGIATEATYPTL